MTPPTAQNLTTREAALAFDPGNLPDAFFEDPFPTYGALRRFDPVHHNPDSSVLLTRYADVALAYRYDRFSSDKKALFGPKFGAEIGPGYDTGINRIA